MPSHYEMIAEVRRILESWPTSIFLGFNSLSFDEEFLRQAFYLCLYNPYLTNTQGNARADVLNLCRMTAALRPDVIRPSTDDSGRTIFKLKQIAEANGITVPFSHSAMADVSTTLALCQLIRNQAPDIWSQFLRFSKKATVESFITGEEAFVISVLNGNFYHTRVVTRIGSHSKQQTRHYCLDVSTDLDVLKKMSDDELIHFLKGSSRPILTVRTNAAPTLWALYDVDQEYLAPFQNEIEILERVECLRKENNLMERLSNMAQFVEPEYQSSPHLEEQIYGHPFPSRLDEDLINKFHAGRWQERVMLAEKFSDVRYRQISHRLIYFEQPSLLGIEHQINFKDSINKRLMATADTNVPWRTISAAIRELEEILMSDIGQEEKMKQTRFLDYLIQRQETIATSNSVQN